MELAVPLPTIQFEFAPGTNHLHFTYPEEGITEPDCASNSRRVASNLQMSFRDLIQDVFRTLWAHRVRTLLTMFGIAWGVVSIVLMVAAGEGLRVGQAKHAETLGRDIMIVFHGRTSLQAGGTRAGRLVHWTDSDIPRS